MWVFLVMTPQDYVSLNVFQEVTKKKKKINQNRKERRKILSLRIKQTQTEKQTDRQMDKTVALV